MLCDCVVLPVGPSIVLLSVDILLPFYFRIEFSDHFVMLYVNVILSIGGRQVFVGGTCRSMLNGCLLSEFSELINRQFCLTFLKKL